MFKAGRTGRIFLLPEGALLYRRAGAKPLTSSSARSTPSRTLNAACRNCSTRNVLRLIPSRIHLDLDKLAQSQISTRRGRMIESASTRAHRNHRHHARQATPLIGPRGLLVARRSPRMFAAEWEVATLTEPVDPEALIAALVDRDILVMFMQTRLGAEVLVRFPKRVRALATYSVGHEHIDFATARDRNIAVFNTPDVLTDSVAGAALTLPMAADSDMARDMTVQLYILRRDQE